MEEKISFEQLTKFSQQDTEAIASLAAKLGTHNQPFSDSDLQEIIDSTNTHILVARENDSKKIIAMVTISVYRIPYVKKAYLDDFVVDEAYRGQGVGGKLFRNALDFAKENDAAYADFTSNPERIAGNKLYEKLGFKKRDTNVYRLEFAYGEK